MTIKEYALALKESKIIEERNQDRVSKLQRKLDEDMNDKLKFN
jgi:hypothetical protein